MCDGGWGDVHGDDDGDDDDDDTMAMVTGKLDASHSTILFYLKNGCKPSDHLWCLDMWFIKVHKSTIYKFKIR